MKSSKTPLVSICCLVYNQEDYLRRTFDAFLNQKTEFEFEILIHDDASTDNSKSIIEQYTKKDLRFKPIYQSINKYSQGERIWFKYLFPKSKGKYIAICDGDDYWTDPFKLQKQVDFLEKNKDYSIVGTKFKCFHENTGLTSDWEHEKNKIPNANIKTLIDGNFIFASSSLFRNDFKIEPWWQDLPIGDWPFYMIQIKDRKVKILDEFMGIYRVHDNGIFSKISKIKQQTIELQCLTIIQKNMKYPTGINRFLTRKILKKKMGYLYS